MADIKQILRLLLGLIFILICEASVTNQCGTTVCPSCKERICDDIACQHDGECVYVYDNNGNKSSCYCKCMVGFDGNFCPSNRMKSTFNQINAINSLNVYAARTYVNRSIDIYIDQKKRNESHVPESLYFMIFIGEEIVTKVAETVSHQRNRVDLNDFTKEITLMMVNFLDGIKRYGCTVMVDYCTNKINTTGGNNLTARAELIMLEASNLLLETTFRRNHDEQSFYQSGISITAIKSKGNKLDDIYFADFGSFTLPFWETFQDNIGKDTIRLNVMTFTSSPYVHLDNLDDSLTGSKLNTSTLTYNYDNTAPVVRLSATGKEGDFMDLEDTDDPIQVGIDMSKIYGNDDYFGPMEPLNGDEGKFLLSIDINDTTLEGYMVEFKIETKKDCEIWGKYGKNMMPGEENFDIYIQTRGTGRIRRKTPRDMALYFRQSKLKITIENSKRADNMTIDPMAFVLRCEDDFFKRRRRKRDTEQRHKYRLSSIGGRCLNTEKTAWLTTVDDKCVKIYKARANELIFKSTFFGTFSAQAFFIAPTPIKFEEIFLNFEERLAEAPHVLVTFISVIVVGMVLVIPLRRADIGDRRDWTYLPLLGNQDEGYRFFLSVQTSTSSQRRLSANVYIEMIGKDERTGPRILSDGIRENFRRGTSCHFILSSKKYIGDIKKVLIWHDNTGKSPRWLPSKLIIIDGSNMKRYTYLCGKWLSLDCDDGQTWRCLFPTCTDTLDTQMVFEDSTRRRFYDDFLMLSILKRPQYSVFTRVQRMWTIIGMMFLAMLTSAMWYELSEEKDNSGFGQLNVGPFILSYHQVYAGAMSSLITLIPSIIIIGIFKHRKEKCSSINSKYNSKSYSEDKTKIMEQKGPDIVIDNAAYAFEYATEKGKLTESNNVSQIGNNHTLNGSSLESFTLPWWTVFVAYALIVICISCGGVFTFFYSLQFGKEKTNNWFLSFIFGTAGSNIVIEPIKAIGGAAFVVCFMRKSAEKEIQVCPSPNESSDIQPNLQTDFRIYPCPNKKDEDIEIKLQRRRSQLDRKLTLLLRSFVAKTLYVCLVILLGSNSDVTQSYYQNAQLTTSLNSSYQAKSITDIWVWMEEYYIPAVWTKLNPAYRIRPAYEQRFLHDSHSYRLGLTRLRQVRVQDNCSVPSIMTEDVKICKFEYSQDKETQLNYCPGWETYNSSCFEYDDNDLEANEEVDAAFLYQNTTTTKSFPYFGQFAVYNGGGYMVNLGPKQSLALTYVQNLTAMNWIDEHTRALFIDTNSFNPATRLFSHTQIVFELSEFGNVAWSFRAFSSNLYPYKTAFDYVVLAFQLLFCVVIILKFVSIILETYKLRLLCLRRFTFYCDIIDLTMCCSAPVFYILRILHTVKAVEEIRKDKYLYVSFEGIEIYETLYVSCLAGMSFLAILRLLEPLTFNFYFFILQRSLISARSTLLHYLLLVVLIVAAFGCYLSLAYGREVEEFKNMSTSFLTLFKLLLAMISFRGSLRMQTLQSRVVIALFSVVMSLVMVNVFITALTMVFDEIKNGGQKFAFDNELNDHFWRRTNLFIKSCFRRCFPEKTDPRKDDLDRYLEEVETMTHRFERMVRKAGRNEKLSTKLLLTYVIKQFERIQKYRTRLDCVVTRTRSNTRYSFLHREDDETKVSIIFPQQIYDVDITCYEGNVFLQIHKTKGDASDEQDDLVYLCSSNSCWKIIRPEKDNGDTFISEKIPNFMFLTKGKDCSASHIKTEDETQNARETQTLSEAIPVDVVFEKHIISPDGGVIRMDYDPDVEISIQPKSVQDESEIQIGRGSVLDNVRIYIQPSSDITKTSVLSMPHGRNNQDFKNTAGSQHIMLKKDGGDWTTVNSAIQNQNQKLSFNIKKLTENQMVQIFVKQTEMMWVDHPMDIRDSNLLKAINVVSRYHYVASEWKKIAETLGIRYNADTNGEDLRISTPDVKGLPLCQEEKCFFVLYRWYQQHPEIEISDLKQLVSDLGFKHAADYVS